MDQHDEEVSPTVPVAREASVKMKWSSEHDILFLREVLVNSDVFKYKAGSRERGNEWDLIAGTLNSLKKPFFKVDQRSLRDRLNKLLKEYIHVKNFQEKASGISVPEVTELDNLLEEVHQKKCEGEITQQNATDEKSKIAAKEKKDASDVRLKAMETWSETKKRDNESDPFEGELGSSSSSSKRKRNNGNDTVDYLREKAKTEYEMKNKDIDLRKQELELQKEKERNANNRYDQFMTQMQQQNQALIQFLGKLSDKL